MKYTGYRSHRRTGLTLRSLALFAALLFISGGALAQEGYAITGANVVPMDREGVLENRTVLVRGDRIDAIVPADTADIPAGYQRIDGQGRFLAPGLADMHTHPMTQAHLDAFLANGITLIRAMWGEPVVLQMRSEIEQGERTGPRIITGGRIVDGDPVIHYGTDRVLDRADAERVVRRQKDGGYDFIKVYSNLSLEAFDAIADVAAAEGIPYAGHVPSKVPMAHALQAGMQTSEHMTGVSDATVREGQQYVWPFSPDFGPFAERVGSGELTPDRLFDEQKLQDLAAQAADTGHWLVPTLVVLRGVSLTPDQVAAEWQRPELRYTDFTVKTFWRLFTSMAPPGSEAFYAGRQALFEQNLHQLKAFHDAGARILAGTDALNPFVNIGYSLVQELELFVEAGLTPYEALRTATVNAAEYAGEPGKAGVVAAGARADLVLLDANPLENFAAYRDIDGVLANGRWLDRQGLDALLAGVEAQSERKARLFEAEATWPVREGEFVPMYAGFETFEGDRNTGTVRIARAHAGEAVAALLAERRGGDGDIETFRMETDASGAFTRMERRRSTGADAPDLEIVRTDAGFEVHSGENPVVTEDSGAGTVMTHSALDALVLQPVTAAMEDGETRRIEALCLEAGDALEPCTVTLTRHPSEVIHGHFYFSGVNPVDVRVESASASRTATFKMGGGFYAGWPVWLELGRPGDAVPVRFDRIL